MPTLEIHTNVKRDAIPEGFLAAATDKLHSLLSKPPEYIMVHVNPDQVMSFGGTSEPCANIALYSIGKVGPDFNPKIAKELSDLLESQLGISKKRFYINIYDIPRPSCVWNGTTFG